MDTRTEWQKRIGVGEPARGFLRLKGTNDSRPVTVEEGPHRGKVGGAQVHHWDGSVSATIRPETVHITKPGSADSA